MKKDEVVLFVLRSHSILNSFSGTRLNL